MILVLLIKYLIQFLFDFYLDVCKIDMKKQCDFSNVVNGICCDFIKICYVVGMFFDYVIYIFFKIINGDMFENLNLLFGSKQMVNIGRFYIIFFFFVLDYDIYVILKFGVVFLFFIDDFGGCDMFVVIEINKGDKFIVFYIN